eukprot:TRINITY_DN6903_c0_g1_i3.p1 TRINITY_DN6903_c0_g1~~TRINITY_DN6903_c0_g1_i3.p1  ORF type:complete len:294 (+),score=61.75 TRINITY_DN6903_c0_g1_i3:87-968(+)
MILKYGFLFGLICIVLALKPFSLDDFGELNQLESVVVSSDDKITLYVASQMDLKRDKTIRSIWKIEDDSKPKKLIDNADNHWNPSFSSDGTWIFYLSDVSGDSQLWRINRNGGNSTRITDFEGGIIKYSISPDQKSAVFLAKIGKMIPNSNTGILPPMVITRFQSVRDGDGFLYGNLSTQIFSIDLETKSHSQLSFGSFDNWCPTYSPNGKLISFLSKRRGKFPDKNYFIDVYLMDANGRNTKKVNTKRVHPLWRCFPTDLVQHRSSLKPPQTLQLPFDRDSGMSFSRFSRPY